MMLAAASYTMHAAYAPTLQSSTPVIMRSTVGRSPAPVLNLQQRFQSAALGAALAASVAVNSASAADPWPYSTLLSKVQTDQVAKVRAPSATAAGAPSPCAAVQPCAPRAAQLISRLCSARRSYPYP